MKIYTKTGDKGTTALFGGKRVSKSDLRIDAYGTVDELNSHIGLLRDITEDVNRRELLIDIQNTLFVIGSNLAVEPGNEKVTVPEIHDSYIQTLENAIDAMDSELPPMRHFILPGGHIHVSYCHIARCVCRRAERLVVALFDIEPGNPLIVHYLNRLSDYLFVLSRKMAVELNADEIPWISKDN